MISVAISDHRIRRRNTNKELLNENGLFISHNIKRGVVKLGKTDEARSNPSRSLYTIINGTLW